MKMTLESQNTDRDIEVVDHVEVKGNSTPGSGNSTYKGPGHRWTWCIGSEEQKAGQYGLTLVKQWGYRQ